MYTLFAAMFMEQMDFDHPAKDLSHAKLKQLSRALKFQAAEIQDLVCKTLTKNSQPGQVSWQDFADSLKQLYPRSVPEKMTLFLKAFAPEGLSEDQFRSHSFTRREIIAMCRSALQQLLHEDQEGFFEQLSVNFAKFIYQIIGYKYEEGKNISFNELMHSVSKANKNDFKLLSLIFGDVGMIDVTDHAQVMIRNRRSEAA